MWSAVLLLVLAQTTSWTLPEIESGVSPARMKEVQQKGYPLIRFAQLKSYPFLVTTDRPRSEFKAQIQVPSEVMALDGKKVSVRGYMLPIDFTTQGISHFVVGAADLCHFGLTALPNEWIEVKMIQGRKARYANFNPITVYGTLRIGEVIKNGYLESFYRIEGETFTLHGENEEPAR